MDMYALGYMNLVIRDFEIEINYLESKVKQIDRVIDFEKRTANKEEDIAGLKLHRENFKEELSTYKEDLNSAKKYKSLMEKGTIPEDILKKIHSHSQVFNRK